MPLVILVGVSVTPTPFCSSFGVGWGRVYAASRGQTAYLQGLREVPHTPGLKVRCLDVISPLKFYLYNLPFHPLIQS